MDQEQELSQDFTLWSFLKFIAPSIFVFVFIAVYQTVDGLFIKMFIGELAISAINLYYPIISLVIAAGVMIGTGGNAMIVKKVGEGKRKEAGETFSRVMVFTILIGVIFTVISLVFADPIMRLCGATEGTIEYLRQYYVGLSTFSIAIIMQTELGILIIGEGKTVVAAVVIMVGGVLNCVLDYVFMKWFNMGIHGAAIATVIGYCITIVYAVWFYIITKQSSYKLELAKPDLKEMGEICFNGSSDMVSNLAQGVTVLISNHLAFRCYGEIGISALTIITYLQTLIMMVFMGLTSAVEPVFSFHYGSGNTEMRKKVYKLSMTWCILIGVACCVLLFAVKNPVISVFFEPGTELYEICQAGYLLSLPGCLFVGINVFGSGLFTAFSNGLVSGMLSFVRTFLILVACLYGLTALLGGTGLWIAWPASEVISLIVTMLTLKRFRARYEY